VLCASYLCATDAGWKVLPIRWRRDAWLLHECCQTPEPPSASTLVATNVAPLIATFAATMCATFFAPLYATSIATHVTTRVSTRPAVLAVTPSTVAPPTIAPVASAVTTVGFSVTIAALIPS